MLLNKTFYQGQSLTIGVLIADTYDTASLQSSAIIVGEKKITSTVINQMLRFELSSEDTRNFITSKTVNLVIGDVYFGRREYPLGSLCFEKTKGQTIDNSIDTGYTVVFNATINEVAITIDSIMYDYVKGDKGDMADLPAGTVIDPNYVHTDNNYTDEDAQKVQSAIQAETDPTVPAWAKEPTKPTYTASEVGAEPIKGSDDNYVTTAEKTKLSNLSGINTGDQDLSGLAPINHTHPYEPATSHTTLLDKNAESSFQHIDTTVTKSTNDNNKIVVIENNTAVTMSQDTFFAYLIRATNHNNRIIGDLGAPSTDVQNEIALLKFYEPMAANIKLFYCPHLTGNKYRESGVLKFVSKGYDASRNKFDLTQTTAANQPYIAGNIAQNERLRAVNPNGGVDFLSLTSNSFLSTDKWSLSAMIQFFGVGAAQTLFQGGTNSKIRIAANGTLTLINENNTSVNGTINYSAYTGKNTHLGFVAAGNGTVKVYVNGVLSETIIIASNFTFASVDASTLPFYGAYLNVVLSNSERDMLLDYNANRNIFPEIESVQIGTQTWATSNCAMAATPQGNVIANVTDNTIWASSQTIYDTTVGTVYDKLKAAAMWCHHGNSVDNGAVYGKLYNWFAVKLLQMDIDYYNAANPTTHWGFRVPDYNDYLILYNFGGGIATGQKLKMIGFDYFDSPNFGASNEYGFTAIGSGDRTNTGTFNNINKACELYLLDNKAFYTYYSDGQIRDFSANSVAGYSLRLIVDFDKLVTLGDSVTFQNKWQIHLSRLKYRIDEVTTGTGGFRATGVPSSRIIPLINDSLDGQKINKSIYERANDVMQYNPKVVLLYGGINDLGNGILGSINDAVYTGVAVSSNPPSFYSAYKGTLEKLIAQNPNARIVCIVPHWISTIPSATQLNLYSAIPVCAELYNLECINLYENVGINQNNYATYLGDGVHPNDLGGKLIGEYIASILNV